MTARQLIVHAVVAGALVAIGNTAAALAQSPPPPPRQSTQLSTPDSGSLVVDFSKPADDAKPAPKPEAVEKPAGPGAAEPVCLTGDPSVDAIVREAGSRYGLDPCFIVAVMSAESRYRRYAVSPKGACGYMQLMPDTARRFGVTDIFDARQNIYAGTQYLRFLLDRFAGSMELALAGYNAGEGAVERYGMRIPPFLETQNYVRVISARYLSRHAAKLAVRAPLASAAPPVPAPNAANTPARPTVAWRISVSFDDH